MSIKAWIISQCFKNLNRFSVFLKLPLNSKKEQEPNLSLEETNKISKPSVLRKNEYIESKFAIPHPPKDPPDNYNPKQLETTKFKPVSSMAVKVFRKLDDKDQLGPKASKNDDYKNPEYYSYHRYSIFDILEETMKLRKSMECADRVDPHKIDEKSDKEKTTDCTITLSEINSPPKISDKPISVDTPKTTECTINLPEINYPPKISDEPISFDTPKTTECTTTLPEINYLPKSLGKQEAKAKKNESQIISDAKANVSISFSTKVMKSKTQYILSQLQKVKDKCKEKGKQN